MIGYKINVNSLKDKNMYKSFINASQIGEYITTWQWINNVIVESICTFDILYYI